MYRDKQKLKDCTERHTEVFTQLEQAQRTLSIFISYEMSEAGMIPASDKYAGEDMKMIAMVLSRLSIYMKKSKAIFVLFCIGGVTSGLMFLYFYGNVLPFVRERSQTDFSYRKYTVTLPEAEVIFEIEDKLGSVKPAIEAVKIKKQFEAAQLDPRLTQGGYVTSYGAVMKGNYPEVYEIGTVPGNSGRPSVALPGMMVSQLYGMTSVELFGQEYEISGYDNLSDCIMMPLDTFLTITDYADSFLFITEQRLDIEEERAFIQSLEKLFPGASVESTNSSGSAVTFINMTAIIFVIYLSSLLSFMFLMKYMSERLYQENVVCAIVGASKDRILALTVIEAFVLTILCLGTAFLLHVGLYPAVFVHLNIVENIYYGPADYLAVFFMSLLATLICLIPFAARVKIGSIMDLKWRQGGK